MGRSLSIRSICRPRHVADATPRSCHDPRQYAPAWRAHGRGPLQRPVLPSFGRCRRRRHARRDGCAFPRPEIPLLALWVLDGLRAAGLAYVATTEEGTLGAAEAKAA